LSELLTLDQNFRSKLKQLADKPLSEVTGNFRPHVETSDTY
jgi:hypothetical protein